jgi:molecular chaperone DnaK
VLTLTDRLPARSPTWVRFVIDKYGRLGVLAADLRGGGTLDIAFETEAVTNAEALPNAPPP